MKFPVFAPVTLTLSVQLLFAGIVRPEGKVTLDPPATANSAPAPPQVVLTSGEAAIVMPAGRLSTSGAVSVRNDASALFQVAVNLETPPTLIELGKKALLSKGAPASSWQTEISPLSMVTAPFRAKMRPLVVAPVLSVILESASKLPTKAVVVPGVAELPICQNTLQFCPPVMTRTAELLAVVDVLPT